ncbi:MAG: hypothetical protein WDO13_09530 [Verrucomicrobiota bacterium]
MIRTFLRWTPDAMTAFDYTTVPFPTLSIRLRADAPAISPAGLWRAGLRPGADAAARPCRCRPWC